jgi:tetratricopeptide (TPR) repeat protein
MAFARLLGRKIEILHSHREGRRVGQMKLYEFDNAAEARAVGESPERWNLLCASLVASLGKQARFDGETLRHRVLELSRAMPDQDAPDNPVEELATKLRSSLQSFDAPLTPPQRAMLEGARGALIGLLTEIPERLTLLSRKGLKEKTMDDVHAPGTADRLLDQGLTLYEQGKWDDAKRRFLAGLNLDREHVDLLVHTGLCELTAGNLALALRYFEQAAAHGRIQVGTLIQKDPTFYVTAEAKKKAVEKMTTCLAPKEHNPRRAGACHECVEDYLGTVGSFRGHLEVRPFLRAVHNQAHVLMKLGRYQAALEVLHEYQRYEDDPGTSELIGHCHLELGNLTQAKKWSGSLLWPSACYYRALILSRLDETEEALSVLIRGVFWNPHIARMLVGQEEPERVRWVGDALPPRLQASEFFHNERTPFTQDARMRCLIHLVLDDPEIQRQRTQLDEEIVKRDTNRNHRMNKLCWDLFTGQAPDELLKRHAARLVKRLEEPVSGYWLPRPGELLPVELLTAKTLNWKLRLQERSDATLYLRGPGVGPPAVGHRFSVRVVRAWRHRRSLFVTGEVEGM